MLGIVELILPVFGVIALGWFLARFGFIDEAGERGINALVYWATTPALLFRTMATMRPIASEDLGIVAAYFAATLAVYVLALEGARRAGWRLDRRAVAALGVTFSNSVLMGIPIIERAYGAEGLVLLTLIISVHAAIMVGLSTLLCEIGRGAAHPAATLGATAMVIARNPFLVAIALGLVASIARLRLPDFADRTLALVGAATTPVALVCVGAGLARIRLAGALVPGAAIGAAKLLVMPVAVWVAARHVFALPPLAVAVATASAALPSGINAFILARRYNVAIPETTAAILLSTLASPLTLALAIAATRP